MTLAVSLASNQETTVEQHWVYLLASRRLVHYGTRALVLSFHSQLHSLGFGMLDVLDRDFYPDESCDGQCSLCVLEQRMLGWWDGFQMFEANSKHKLSCFTDRSWSTVFAVHQHSETLQTCCTSAQWNSPDDSCAMSRGWGCLSPGWWQWRWEWLQGKWTMSSIGAGSRTVYHWVGSRTVYHWDGGRTVCHWDGSRTVPLGW